MVSDSVNKGDKGDVEIEINKNIKKIKYPPIY
jgi:hypothetical protein